MLLFMREVMKLDHIPEEPLASTPLRRRRREKPDTAL
jgi:hypothetical protein